MMTGLRRAVMRAAIGLAALAAFGGAFAAPSKPALGTRAGAFTVERPTLVSLGFEWRIQGDDDRNARVEVSFRKRGETAWRKGLPLLRLQGEQVPAGGAQQRLRPLFRLCTPNMFAGSC